MTEPLHPLQERALSYIQREGLIAAGDHILAAVSGGPDSVALFDILAILSNRLELSQITLIHLDHQLRGRESSEDRLFVQALAAHSGFPFHCETLDAEAMRRAGETISLEMAARKVRHRFFQSVRETLEADKIALGHNANDQAEEILLRLLRGTGPSGLAGMLPKTPDRIIRPLLFATRMELLSYLHDRGLVFREDSSNSQTFCQRNALRIEVFPTLERHFHPRVVESLCRHAELARTEEDYWSLQVRREWATVMVEDSPERIVLSLPPLLILHSALRKRVLRFAIERLQGNLQGIFTVHIDMLSRLISRGIPEKSLHLPRGLRALTRNDSIILHRDHGMVEFLPGPCQVEIIPGPGRFHLPHFRLDLSITEKVWGKCSDPVTGSTNAVFLDGEKVRWPMTVRFRKEGDRFYPLGLRGSKKLQDFFTDLKIPKAQRACLPLLCDTEKICWIMGYRLDDRVKVTHETKIVLFVEWQIRS